MDQPLLFSNPLGKGAELLSSSLSHCPNLPYLLRDCYCSPGGLGSFPVFLGSYPLCFCQLLLETLTLLLGQVSQPLQLRLLLRRLSPCLLHLLLLQLEVPNSLLLL